MVDFSNFYKLLADTTGVDLSAPMPTQLPGDTQSAVVQGMVDSKAQLEQVNDRRTFDRGYKRDNKVPSIFLQAQRAVSGETLIANNRQL